MCRLLCLTGFALLLGCGQPIVESADSGAPPDSGLVPDAGELPDAGVPDAGVLDAGEGPDGGEPPDAGSNDAGPSCGCPMGRSCLGTACVVDLDDRRPVSFDATATFDAVWSFLDQSYGAFPAKAVDWNDVRTRYRPLIAEAGTDFAAKRLLMRAVEELGDGHTSVSEDTTCRATAYHGLGYSNSGACAALLQGKLIVYRVGANNPSGFRLGDQLLSFDGRTPAQAIGDVEAQPRCYAAASSRAQARQLAIDSVMYRVPTDRRVEVVRTDGSTAELSFSVLPQASWLRCDGRLEPAGLRSEGFGMTSALLGGDVLYVYLPFFGGYDSSGQFVDTPVIAVLQQLFTSAAPHKGVVLDLRSNGGGYPSVYMALASWLYASPTPLFQCQEKAGPGRTQHTTPWTMTSAPAAMQYERSLAVLTNSRSFSAADFASAWLNFTGRARSFGAPSGGGFGSGAQHKLGAFAVSYNSLLCTDLQGNPLEGHPPPVHVPLELDPADVATGKDTVIQEAATWVRAQP